MIITLEQAKKNLNIYFEVPQCSPIEDDYDDEIVERCINSAIGYVETYTNYALVEKEVNIYTDRCGTVDVVTYPFKVITTDVSIKRRALSSLLFYKSDSEIKISVGDWGDEDIRPELIEACYKLITYFYENRDMYKWDIPTDVQMLLNPLRRSPTI